MSHRILTRNFNQSALNDAQIRAVAPSVFALQAHESRSDRYGYVPTIDILNGLRREGFEVYEAKQSRTRLDDRHDFTTHLLRLRHPDSLSTRDAYGRIGEHVEIILRNSHDGGSAFEISQGLFRLVCANGLVAAGEGCSIKVPHRGDIIGRVIEGAYEIVESSKQLQSVVQDWKAIELLPAEQLALANAAATLRFDENVELPENIGQRLTAVRRWEDNGNDLWTSWNRVQEAVIKGGTHLGYKNNRKRVTRAVTGIDQDLKLNKALWVLGDQLAKIKTGKISAPATTHVLAAAA